MMKLELKMSIINLTTCNKLIKHLVYFIKLKLNKNEGVNIAI